MKYLLERKNYYNVDDIVLIEYWYNGMITPVKILEITGRKFKVTHNITESSIFNAPDEMITSSDILDIFKKSEKV
jgi:hypothetical protein